MQSLNIVPHEGLLVRQKKLRINTITVMCVKIWVKRATLNEAESGTVGLEGSSYIKIFQRSIFRPFCLILS